MHLVLGLGNPGRRYDRTRHNVGFRVVDRLAERQGTRVERAQHGALVESLRIGDEPVVVAKPQSFMNLSGQPAASLRGVYKLTNAEVIVVHDDVDLPLGDVRVKKGGGHGGHNGLRDLNAKIGPDYARVRLGVGRPPEGWDTADWVLSAFSAAEETSVEECIDRAADAVVLVVERGVEAAMNQLNVRAPARLPPGPGPGADR
jgi:peptidyl-tRNA hydrolase, PTH1 family